MVTTKDTKAVKKKIKSPRAKGHNYELQIVKLFKELGWDCVTSRSESKRTDDAGVDVCYTSPFSIQAKCWESAPSYHKVLAKMPRKNGNFNLLFHKRNHQGSVVVINQEDFIEIVKMLIESGAVKPC